MKKSLVLISALLLSQIALADGDFKQVLSVKCMGNTVDIYFSPEQEITGQAQYTSTEITTGTFIGDKEIKPATTNIEYRNVGLFLGKMGTIKTVINGSEERITDLLGAIYNKNGDGTVQQDIAKTTQFGETPVLNNLSLKVASDAHVSIEAGDYIQKLGGLVAVTGGMIERLGDVSPTEKAGIYHADFDWSQVQWAYSCNN